MSLWYLSNDETASDRAKEFCVRIGLQSSAEFSGQFVRGQVFLKRVASTPTHAVCDFDHWIWSAGTVVRDGRLGKEALQRTYSDFVSGGLRSVQENALGHYAVAIRKENCIQIFTDPLGALSLYYRQNGNEWFVSNSLSLCARSASVTPAIDETRLQIIAFQSTLPGEDTFYAGIKRLSGTHALQIFLPRGNLKICDLSVSNEMPNFSGIEEAIGTCRQSLQTVSSELARVGLLGLFGTGGIDSRTVLAPFLGQDASIQMMYAVGNSKLSDFDLRDLEIVEAIASRFDLPFSRLDWSGSQPYDRERLCEFFNLYGFDYEIYGASDHFLDSLNCGITPNPDLFLGGYGAVITNTKPWQRHPRSYTNDEFITDSMRTHSGPVTTNWCIRDKDLYRAEFARLMRSGLTSGGFNATAPIFGFESYVRARLHVQIRSEARFLNLANQFSNYICPFLLRQVHDPFIRVPPRFRLDEELQIRLLKSFVPELAELPLYSGWGPATIDPATSRLIRQPSPIRNSPRAFSRFLPKPVKHLLKQIRPERAIRNQHRFPEGSRDANVVETYGAAIMRNPLGRKWFHALDEFSVKEITRIHHYLEGVSFI